MHKLLHESLLVGLVEVLLSITILGQLLLPNSYSGVYMGEDRFSGFLGRRVVGMGDLGSFFLSKSLLNYSFRALD